MKKAAICVHSQTGNTKKFAEKIQSKLESFDYNVSLFGEGDFDKIESIGDYDVICLGCPTHGGKISAPFRRVVDSIQNLNFDGKKLITFSTCAGRGADNVCAEISDCLEGTGIDTVSSLALIWDKENMDDLINVKITKELF
jgi:flavodoxin